MAEKRWKLGWVSVDGEKWLGEAIDQVFEDGTGVIIRFKDGRELRSTKRYSVMYIPEEEG